MIIRCVRCGRLEPHYAKSKCRNCYQYLLRKPKRVKPRQEGKSEDDMTEEELDALIASRLPTMPKEREFFRKEITDDSDVRRRVAGVCRVLLVPGRVKR